MEHVLSLCQDIYGNRKTISLEAYSTQSPRKSKTTLLLLVKTYSCAPLLSLHHIVKHDGSDSW